MLKKIVFIAFLFTFLAGCQLDKVDLENEPTKSRQPTTNEVRDIHGMIENSERLDLFVDNVQSEKKDKVRLIRYTTEGDPIFHDLDYNGSKLTFTLDTTKDKFGQGNVISNDCQSIQRLESDTETKYLLEGCTDPQISELLTISYDTDKQDLFAFELKYGEGKKNIINTKDQELIKDLQNGETVVVSDFQFSKAEMNKIYKLMVFSNYLEEKKLSKECNKKPFAGYELTVWINYTERHFEWSECDDSTDGKEMRELVSNLLTILENNPTYQSLPDS
ncbi:MAG: DUF4362 domain-containing protein [Bacillus sp. (in: Bacteria)]|nr:DUF4362 domain-containing protein [Bacillus sp. (in: firmicutes)]